MKKAVSATIWGLLWLTFEVAASASTLNIENHNLDVNYGGAFLADLNGMSANSFNVFCVDYRNDVNVPDSYPVAIDTPSVTLADTRYGTTTGFYWNSLVAGAPSTTGMQFGNAYDRYVMAGWLTTQYDFSPGADTGALDVGIQNAIWTLLDVDGVSFTTGNVDAELAAAVNFMTMNPVAFAQLGTQVEIFTSNYTTPGNGDIGADTDLNLNDAGNRYSIGKQEMITVIATPEPAVFVLVGCGLVLIGVVFRRRSR
jgi:hypothetical protein